MVPIEDYPDTQQALLNTDRSKTNYFEFRTGDEYWSSAYLISVEKQNTISPNEAVIWQLLRMAMEQESWTDETTKNITTSEFLDFIFANGRYMLSGKGFDFSINTFWEEYQTIVIGVSNCVNCTFTRNGTVIENQILLKEEDIIAVTCFSDNWNFKQYFIETKTEWWFFDWSTTV